MQTNKLLTKQLSGRFLSCSFAIPLRFILWQNYNLKSAAYRGVREKMNLNHKQSKILASLAAFLLCTIFIAQLEADPIRMFEIESEDIREHIVMPKSRMTKLERKGEAEWLNQ